MLFTRPFIRTCTALMQPSLSLHADRACTLSCLSRPNLSRPGPRGRRRNDRLADGERTA
jgi:hypothetical protein